MIVMVIFDQKARGGATRLKLTNAVVQNLQDYIPEFRRDSCVSGWRHVIGQSLNDQLEYIPK